GQFRKRRLGWPERPRSSRYCNLCFLQSDVCSARCKKPLLRPYRTGSARFDRASQGTPLSWRSSAVQQAGYDIGTVANASKKSLLGSKQRAGIAHVPAISTREYAARRKYPAILGLDQLDGGQISKLQATGRGDTIMEKFGDELRHELSEWER